jgi:hypothetical protein
MAAVASPPLSSVQRRLYEGRKLCSAFFCLNRSGSTTLLSEAALYSLVGDMSRKSFDEETLSRGAPNASPPGVPGIAGLPVIGALMGDPARGNAPLPAAGLYGREPAGDHAPRMNGLPGDPILRSDLNYLMVVCAMCVYELRKLALVSA